MSRVPQLVTAEQDLGALPTATSAREVGFLPPRTCSPKDALCPLWPPAVRRSLTLGRGYPSLPGRAGYSPAQLGQVDPPQGWQPSCVRACSQAGPEQDGVGREMDSQGAGL